MGKTRAKTKTVSAYADVEQVLKAGDRADRACLAARADVAPEVLYYLAGDDAADVRCVVAGNPACPAQADLNLASDPTATVRLRLAEKLAERLPQMTPEEMRDRAFEQLLGTLARDEAMAVRQVIAEAAKALASLPQGLVYRLAEDAVDAIACPVLSDSSVLTDAQLLQLATSRPVAGTGQPDERLLALARRKTLSASLSERIVEAGDDRAIAALLYNAGAEIADATLEGLAERAADKPAWHEPLVARPRLTPKTVFALVRFVAKSLLRRLRNRSDLDAHTLSVVERELEGRFGGGGRRNGAMMERGIDKADEEAVERAVALLSQNRLDSEELSEALMNGDERLVAAGLALLADYNMAFVRHVRDAKSAKGVVALAWKAGLTPRFAGQLQATWAHIPRPQVLPTSDGTFPLSKEAMEWQLEFLEGLRE